MEPRRALGKLMGRSRRHRGNVELRRRREREEQRSRETQLAQQAAEFRAEWQKRRRHKVFAYVMFALAPVVVITHMLEHADVLRLFDQSLEDLLIGFPTAFAMLIAGAIALGTE
jgi:hypothetical protein